MPEVPATGITPQPQPAPPPPLPRPEPGRSWKMCPECGAIARSCRELVHRPECPYR